MKHSLFLILTIGALFFTACSSNNPEKFVGVWPGTVNCDGDDFESTLTITLGAADDTINIDIDGEADVVATVDGNNISLTPKTVDGETVSGSGSINTDETALTIQFLIEDDGETETCNGVFTK